MDKPYDYFICFRGDNRMGGLIGNLVYHTLKDIFGYKVYFSSACERVEGGYYENEEKQAIAEVKAVIFILTSDFLSTIDDPKDNVRFEIEEAYKRSELIKFPVAVCKKEDDFQWNKEDDFKKLAPIIGTENAKVLIGTDYAKYLGQREYRNVTEFELCRGLNLDINLLNAAHLNRTNLLKYLEEKFKSRKQFSGSYNLGRITSELFPSINEMDKCTFRSENDTTQYNTLVEMLDDNYESDYVVLGDGGIGKTVLLLDTCDSLLQKGVPTLYIPLHEIRDKTIKEYEFENKLEFKELFYSSPRCVMLLDGFNEIPEENRSEMLDEIIKLASATNIQIVLSSRNNPAQYDRSLVGLKEINLSPLPKDKIVKYLSLCGISAPGEEMYSILGFPLMLTLFTNAIGYSNTHGGHDALIWYQNPSNSAQIIWNFLQTQLHKYVFAVRNNHNLLNYVFVLEYVIPYIGFAMLKEELFEISSPKMNEIIREASSFYQDLIEENMLDRLSNIEMDYDCVSIDYSPKTIKSTVKNLEIFTKKINGNYSFYHQNFRDCLAAIHLVNISRSLGNDCNYKNCDWNRRIEPQVLKYVSEIDNLDTFKSFIDKLRGKEFSSDDLIIPNVFEVLKSWKKTDFSNMNFSCLDLSNISLLDYNLNGAIFDKAIISPMTFIQRGHSDSITCITETEGGNLFITGSVDSTIRVWDSVNYLVRNVISEHQAEVTSIHEENNKLLSSSLDSTILETYLTDGTSRLYYKHDAPIVKMKHYKGTTFLLDTNKKLTILNNDRAIIKAYKNVIDFDYFGNNNLLTTISKNNFFSIYGDNLHVSKIIDLGANNNLEHIVFSNDKETIFISTIKGDLYKYCTFSGNVELLITNLGHINQILDIDNTLISLALNSGDIVLFNHIDKEVKKVFRKHTRPVLSIFYDKKLNMLISGSVDNRICVWNLSYDKELCSIAGFTNWINCLNISNNKRMITVSGDTSVRLWDIEDIKNPKWITTFTEHEEWVYASDISCDGLLAVSGSSQSGRMIIWDLQSFSCKYDLIVSEGDIKSVTFFNNCHEVAACGSDGYVTFVDCDSGTILSKCYLGNKLYRIINVNDNLYVSSLDGTLYCMNSRKKSVSYSVDNAYKIGFRSIAVSKNEKTICIGGEDNYVAIYDGNTHRLIRKIQTKHHSRVMALSPNEKLLAIGDLHGNMSIINLEDNSDSLTVRNHTGEIRVIKFYDDNYIVSGGSDSYIVFSNTLTGSIVNKISPVFHIKNIKGCSFKDIKVSEQSLLNIIRENGGLL